MKRVLICENVVRKFMVGKRENKREITVLNNINLEVKCGEIFGLLGPNGAGKTTLMKIISTLLYPTEGNVYVNGYDIFTDEKKIKRSIGVLLANNRSIYLKLTAKENLKFFCNLYGVQRSIQEERIDTVLKTVNLLERKNDYAENFSNGMLQRLNIARTIVHNPDFLILDEPSNGLDPNAANDVRNTIINLNNMGTTILLTTHNMMEADILSNRVAIIDKGKIISEGDPETLKNSLGNNICEIMVKRVDLENAKNVLKGLYIDKFNIISGDDINTLRIRVLNINKYTLQEINDILHANGIEIKSISLHKPMFEDVFINLTGKVFGKGD
ncbi:MAG: ABC transporter ATP-binding protein [Halanaerobiales bacterium]|nr:ABC transporter ATP-binding protein [Halanaerobiales bacterium]